MTKATLLFEPRRRRPRGAVTRRGGVESAALRYFGVQPSGSGFDAFAMPDSAATRFLQSLA